MKLITGETNLCFAIKFCVHWDFANNRNLYRVVSGKIDISKLSLLQVAYIRLLHV